MSWTSTLAGRYFEALNNRDLDLAVGYWRPGGVDRVVGQAELIAPHEVKQYFTELFEAFPDWRFEVEDMTQQANVCVVRWKVRTTFAGPKQFQGFEPNGGTVEFEGISMLTFDGATIVSNHAYTDSADLARQLGLLPAAGSPSDQVLATVANVKTAANKAFAGDAGAEQIADGVWVVRGGVPRMMNVYLIAEPGGGVTVFDAGIRDMAGSIATAAAHLGGIRRMVLGHADCDHRGAAAALKAPVFVHELEVGAATSANHQRDYWKLGELSLWARPLYPQLFKVWDGAPVTITGTLKEGDSVGDFSVVELPGHAPGLIGLFRRSDRLALVSDCIYTVNPETGRRGRARTPHTAFNQSTEVAKQSILKLRGLRPETVWAGHAKPVSSDVSEALLRAAND
jgi:glyoxylase-like metal-dependent hydrolase (beta-lactamase superfamily II)/predicted ester cyclase